MEEKYVKLQALLSNEDTAKALLSLSAEEASAVLNEKYGVEFSVEELNDIILGIRDAAKEANGEELTDSDLDQVAGGKKSSSAYNYGKSVGKAVPAVVVLVSVAVICGW